ncbi:MAG TPA: hypothetical protein VME44_26380 [Streptosporangiaceae bacterium]|nr:hypothetical protein [Streptosporangiaceae bacterium]
MENVTGTRTSTDQSSAQLKSIVGWTWRDRIGHVWHQLRAAVEEMNYAARRVVEVQARLPK